VREARREGGRTGEGRRGGGGGVAAREREGGKEGGMQAGREGHIHTYAHIFINHEYNTSPPPLTLCPIHRSPFLL
jgi:hypothetical protein